VARYSTRSVSELLPNRFDELTLADVEEILRRVGDAKETLFFERKQTLPREGLAKSCAAFANTYGGLLILGVTDDGELVGMEPVGEAQLWVKDVLRGNVIPLPPFQARWLNLEKESGRGLLLILVEESSTTPHLLTRDGAIYRRSPSSSDPVPVTEQATLLELMRRGADSSERAIRFARDVTRNSPGDDHPQLYAFGLASSGLRSPDFVHAIYVDRVLREAAQQPIVIDDEFSREGTRPLPDSWSQRRIDFQRELGGAAQHERRLDSLVIDSPGAVASIRCFLPGPRTEERGNSPIWIEDETLPWFAASIVRCRELLALAGAHGDLFAYCGLYVHSRQAFYERDHAQAAASNVELRRRFSVDPAEGEDEAFIAHLRVTIRRALGVPPTK